MQIIQMIVITLVLVVFVGRQTPMSVFIPTSDVVDIARAVARAEGFRVQDPKRIYVDLLLEPGGKPRLDGFVSAAVYENDHIVLEISVEKKTGQVVDATRCLLFEFPEVLRFGAEVRQATGAKSLTAAQLSEICGCSLTVRRTPKNAGAGRR